MNEPAFTLLAGLALTQVYFYRLKACHVRKFFWFLCFFYFLVFLIAFAVRLVCVVAGILFYQFPLLSVVLFLITAGKPVWRPEFAKAFPGVPDFFVLSAFWLGFGSFLILPQISVLGAIVWAFVAGFLLLIVVGLKARLSLADAPLWLLGPPVLWFSVGILLLALFGLRAAGNW